MSGHGRKGRKGQHRQRPKHMATARVLRDSVSPERVAAMLAARASDDVQLAAPLPGGDMEGVPDVRQEG